MAITVVGVSHVTAPIEIRERFFVPDQARARIVERVVEAGGVEGAVVLSTCNRTELYVSADSVDVGRTVAERALAAHADLPYPRAVTYYYRRHEREAAEHLFRVAAGLDSLVVGEPQIQGQVGDAYAGAKELKADALGPVLHRLFQDARSVGGRVRAGTRIAEGASSVPAAAVELVTKVFGSLEGRKAMVIGAGEMGRLTLAALLDRGVVEAAVASRTEERAREAASQLGARPVAFGDFWERVAGVDVLVSGTSAPHQLVTVTRLASSLEGRDDPLVVVDIALPRDVEPAVGDLSGVFLYNIDDLQKVVRATEQERREEQEKASELIDEAVDDFMSWYRARAAVPLIRQVRERAERIRRAQLDETLAEIEGLTEADREAIRRASRLAIRKVLHGPTVGLRRLAGHEDGEALLEVARELFRAGSDDEEGKGPG